MISSVNTGEGPASLRIASPAAIKQIWATTALLFIVYAALFAQAPAARTFRSEVDSLFNLGKFGELYDKCSAAKAVFYAAGEWEAYAYCFNGIGYSCSYLSRFEEAERAFHEGLRVAEEKMPDAASDMIPLLRLGLSRVYISNKNLAKAQAEAEKALVFAQKMLPAMHPVHAKIFNSLGIAAAEGWRLEEARLYFERAISVYEANGVGLEKTHAIYSNLGYMSYLFGAYDEAIAYFKKIESYIDHLGPGSIFVTNNMSIAYKAIGNIDKALEYQLKSFSTHQKQFGIYNEAIVVDLLNLGELYMEQATYDESLRSLRLGLHIADSLWKHPHEHRAQLLGRLGGAFAMQQRTDSARYYWQSGFSEAMQIGSKALLQEINMSIAQYYEQKNDFGQALIYLKRADSFSDSQSDRIKTRSLIYVSIGKTLNELNRFDEAITWLYKALELQGINPNAPDLEKDIKRFVSYTENRPAQVFYELARAISRNASQTSESALQQALRFCEIGVNVNERQRQSSRLPQNEDFAWVAKNYGIYKKGLSIAYQLYQISRDAAYLETAWRMADKGRSLLLVESLRHADAKSFAGIPDSLLHKEITLGREIAMYERLTADAAERGDTANVLRFRDDYLFGAKRSYEKLSEQLEREYPRYYDIRYKTQTAAAAEIQKALPPNALFVTYVPDEQTEKLYILTISKTKGIQALAHPYSVYTDQYIHSFFKLTQSITLPQTDKHAQFVQMGHELYKQFVQPIEQQLQDKDKIIFSVEGALHYLPFDLLLSSDQTQAFGRLDYLFRRYEISYQYSGELFSRYAPNPPGVRPADGILAIAPAYPTNQTPTEAGTSARNASDTAAFYRPNRFDYFTPLQFSEEEARSVFRFFNNDRSKLLLKSEAHEKALKTALQQPRRIVHIAAHSFADLEKPRFSGIACSPETSASNGEDGILFVGEIYNLNITADLVVLSSCESGLGKLSNGEGMLGINRAFAYAGAPNIVYALWKVNDKAGSAFMTAFYKQMLAGQSYSAALRAAKLKMLENPATASPNLWGGFLLMGK